MRRRWSRSVLWVPLSVPTIVFRSRPVRSARVSCVMAASRRAVRMRSPMARRWSRTRAGGGSGGTQPRSAAGHGMSAPSVVQVDSGRGKTPQSLRTGGPETGSDLLCIPGGRGRFRTADIRLVRAALLTCKVGRDSPRLAELHRLHSRHSRPYFAETRRVSPSGPCGLLVDSGPETSLREPESTCRRLTSESGPDLLPGVLALVRVQPGDPGPAVMPQSGLGVSLADPVVVQSSRDHVPVVVDPRPQLDPARLGVHHLPCHTRLLDRRVPGAFEVVAVQRRPAWPSEHQLFYVQVVAVADTGAGTSRAPLLLHEVDRAHGPGGQGDGPEAGARLRRLLPHQTPSIEDEDLLDVHHLLLFVHAVQTEAGVLAGAHPGLVGEVPEDHLVVRGQRGVDQRVLRFGWGRQVVGVSGPLRGGDLQLRGRIVADALPVADRRVEEASEKLLDLLLVVESGDRTRQPLLEFHVLQVHDPVLAPSGSDVLLPEANLAVPGADAGFLAAHLPPGVPPRGQADLAAFRVTVSPFPDRGTHTVEERIGLLLLREVLRELAPGRISVAGLPGARAVALRPAVSVLLGRVLGQAERAAAALRPDLSGVVGRPRRHG
ncbi:putative integrase [Streptomyces sp. Tu6071]|nr:putative integrase [Streptomyces sp. Tu6071]